MRLAPLLIAAILLLTAGYSAFGQAAGAGKSDSDSATPAATATPAPELSVKPSSLQIAATRGEIVTRNALLDANGRIERLEFIPLDLQAKDERVVIPAQSINARVDKTEILDHGAFSAPITFDLTNAESGEFTGDLQFRYAGGKLTLPVLIKVKHRWGLPLLVLLVGIALSMAISYYREQGKPRDEIIIKLKRLQADANQEKDLAPEFSARLGSAAVEIEAHLDARKWDKAREALEHASQVLLRWRIGREDWKTQLDAAAKLLRNIGDAKGDRRSVYLDATSEAIEEARRKAPDLEGPDKLRDELRSAADQLARYEEMRSEIEDLKENARALRERRDELLEKTKRWLKRLDELDPKDNDGYDALKKEIAEARQQIEKEPAERRSNEKVGAKGFAATFSFDLPKAFALGPLLVEAKAEWKLKAFSWATYIIAVVLLAGVGFGELYVNKPTFGANAWSDYFTLFAWGFGAETTRVAFVELAKGWGMSWWK